MQRPIHRDWYYINFHLTIDAIKYRLFLLTQKVKDQFKPTEEKKDYFCPRCKSEWTQMEVLSSVSASGEFLCQKCDGVLERHETSHEDRAGHERLSKLMSQVDPLLKQLRQVDQVYIPQNDFEEAEALRIPIQRDESINPSRRLEPVKERIAGTKAGVKTESGPAIEVSLVEAGAAERERAEALRKQEQQNQLPEWHIRSTVTGDRTTLGIKEHARQQVSSGYGTPSKSEDDEEKKKTDADGADKAMMDAYFAQLQADQERERLQPASSSEEEAEEDDDEEEGMFEDVVPNNGAGPSGSRAAPAAGGISMANTPGAATPASSIAEGYAPNGLAPNGSGAHASQSRKRTASPDGGDGPGSDSATPGTSAVATPAELESGPGPAKKAKLDTVEAGDSEEDDEVEFEDAL
jgi:transcription initiation factor TFIIE subunit alpha